MSHSTRWTGRASRSNAGCAFTAETRYNGRRGVKTEPIDAVSNRNSIPAIELKIHGIRNHERNKLIETVDGVAFETPPTPPETHGEPATSIAVIALTAATASTLVAIFGRPGWQKRRQMELIVREGDKELIVRVDNHESAHDVIPADVLKALNLDPTELSRLFSVLQDPGDVDPETGSSSEADGGS